MGPRVIHKLFVTNNQMSIPAYYRIYEHSIAFGEDYWTALRLSREMPYEVGDAVDVFIDVRVFCKELLQHDSALESGEVVEGLGYNFLAMFHFFIALSRK